MKTHLKHQLRNLFLPGTFFGAITGVLTAVTVLLYEFCTEHVLAFSKTAYTFLRTHLYCLIPTAVLLFGLSLLLAFLYKKAPNLRGGGIPTSIALLRGIITFRWLRNLLGVFTLSLTSFLIGVPLGNEGPSVQMGTAVGAGTVRSFAKKHRAWSRYLMTGGACAGFSVATGAPISGILFAIEEAHQRISPMIVIVSVVAVLFARITTVLLAPLFKVSVSLFPSLSLPTLSLRDLWIPLVTGVAVGLFAVLFLNYYRAVNTFFNKTLKAIPHQYKLFAVLMLCVGFGLLSDRFLYSGHQLVLTLFEDTGSVSFLLLILLVRSTLTLCANTNKLTGGLFFPLLSLGAVLSAALGALLHSSFGLEEPYCRMILVLGIVACIASLMKMPITAIVFAVEALGCYGDLLYVISAAAVAYLITELFEVKSINDTVIDDRVESLRAAQPVRVIDTHITVRSGSFAVDKQIRDIFWPANLFVLSITRRGQNGSEVDEHGGKEIREGDVLHVRYSTCNEQETCEELIAIVGEQDGSPLDKSPIS